MSEYNYKKLGDDEFVIYAPDGRVVGKDVFRALARDRVEILNAETAPLLEHIAELERFKDLTIRAIEYPREIEMQGASLSTEERAWLREQFEAYERDLAERRKKAGGNE